MASRSNQSIMFRCPDLPEAKSSLIYELRVVMLSIKDENDSGLFPAADEIPEERWAMCSPSADKKEFSKGGIYACNAQCRLKHVKMGVFGEWSAALFVPPVVGRARRASSTIYSEVSDLMSSPLSLLTGEEGRGTEIDSLASTLDPSYSVLLQFLGRCKRAKETAKIYTLCVFTLQKKVEFIMKELQRSAIRSVLSEENVILVVLDKAIRLMEACSEPGWLAKLVLPPTPGWGLRFIEADEELVRCFVAQEGGGEWADRLKQTDAVNVSHLDYLDDFAFDYNGLARDHFIRVWMEHHLNAPPALCTTP